MTDGIVHELQRAANDSTKSVTEVLRLALTAASKLGLASTTTWIRYELEGYPDGQVLPSYRCVRGKALARHPQRGWIPVVIHDQEQHDLIRQYAEVIETERFGQPIAALEALLKSADQNGRILVCLPDVVIKELSDATGHDTHYTLNVSAPMVAAAINAVRTSVLEWALELERKDIHGESYSFTAQERRAAVDLVPGATYINVSNSRNVNLNNAAQQATATQSLAPPQAAEKKTGLLALAQGLVDLWNKLPKPAQTALYTLAVASLTLVGTWFTLIRSGCSQ